VKIHLATNHKPIPVAARSKAWVCGRSQAGIAGLYPAGDIDMSVVIVVCCQIEVRIYVTGCSLCQRSCAECGVSVIVKPL
jgi:hypothetical protein